MFVATINTPGYMPMDDEPPTFDTTREAWDYLADERRRSEDDFEGVGYSATLNILQLRAEGNFDPGYGSVDEITGEGTVNGDTPGYDGDHDLGLSYSVTEVEHVNYPHEPGRLYDCPVCEAACHCKPNETECIYSGEHSGVANE